MPHSETSTSSKLIALPFASRSIARRPTVRRARARPDEGGLRPAGLSAVANGGGVVASVCFHARFDRVDTRRPYLRRWRCRAAISDDVNHSSVRQRRSRRRQSDILDGAAPVGEEHRACPVAADDRAVTFHGKFDERTAAETCSIRVGHIVAGELRRRPPSVRSVRSRKQPRIRYEREAPLQSRQRAERSAVESPRSACRARVDGAGDRLPGGWLGMRRRSARRNQRLRSAGRTVAIWLPASLAVSHSPDAGPPAQHQVRGSDRPALPGSSIAG